MGALANAAAGKIVGYARVSTAQQDYASQIERLTAAGVQKMFEEKRSGLDKKRPELEKCLDYVREGDTLIVTKVDRLARSAVDFHNIVQGLNDKGVSFVVLDDPSASVSTRTGKLVLGILAVIAQFETEIRRERQMEGIARAKAEGRTGGRPKLLTPEKEHAIRSLRAEGETIRGIAKAVGFSKATVQKVLTPAPQPAPGQLE